MVKSEDAEQLVWNTEYTLSFSHTFSAVSASSENRSYFFAPSIPYLYSDMLHDVKCLEEKLLAQGLCVHRERLCKTLSNRHHLELVRFGFRPMDEADDNKQNVVITCRVHPSETVCSWVLRGFFKFISGQSEESKALLKACDFWVFPMLNPDGVTEGWHRGNSCSRDLNREWQQPSLEASPTIIAGMFPTHSSQEKIVSESTVLVYSEGIYFEGALDKR